MSNCDVCGVELRVDDRTGHYVGDASVRIERDSNGVVRVVRLPAWISHGYLATRARSADLQG